MASRWWMQRPEAKKEYRDAINQAPLDATSLLGERGATYNRDGFSVDTYFQSGLADYPVILTIKSIRTKSEAFVIDDFMREMCSLTPMNIETLRKMIAHLSEEILDIINYSRFFYAELVCLKNALELKDIENRKKLSPQPPSQEPHP